MITSEKKLSLPKVMLINPPQKIYPHAWNSGLYFPVGLLYVAGVIRDICNLKILDCMIDDFEIKKCDNYELQGTPNKKIREAIKDFNPDIVGITIPFTSQSDNGINVCNIVKEINPDCIVVLGGPDPSIRYEFLLNNSKADYCVIGEGEETLPEIIFNYANGKEIAGIEGVALSPAPVGKTASCQFFAPRFFDSLREGRDSDQSGESDIFEITLDAFNFYRDKMSSKEGEIMASVPELTLSNVESIENSTKPVLILQSATWCPPCKIFKKMLASVMHSLSPYISVVVITSDKNEQSRKIKERLGLAETKKIPAFSLRMSDGQNSDLHLGGMNFEELRQWLKQQGVNFSGDITVGDDIKVESDNVMQSVDQIDLNLKLSKFDKEQLKQGLIRFYSNWLPDGYSIKFVADHLTAVCKGSICFKPETRFSPFHASGKLKPKMVSTTFKKYTDSVYDNFKNYIKTLNKK